MIILTIRTDKPEAEIRLFEDDEMLDQISWQAHRELSVTIHKKIEELLLSRQKTWQEIGGIVIYKGSGSFTGLRIGFSVANTIAFAENIPIISSSGSQWEGSGIARLQNGENERVALPDYGGDAHTTKPRK